ncbi:MAG: 16S rRNA (cytosine(967)-C(5))-methyltransferase RsmB [Lachnospiraceae bacterium]|nr:16S rRNA (cytosine(967)-C(5))-methyltransferase RsmB [Lachnospiraceae bacterium]
MVNTVNTRELVLDILLAIEKGEDFSHKLIKGTLDKYDYLERKDKAFIKRIVEGTLERRMYLDFVLNAFSNTPVNKMKPLIRCLMRMSAYQVLFMDQVPDRAVCNEAVKLAAKRKFVNLKGFVNGVLRKLIDSKEHLPMPDRANLADYLSITYSMPEWLVDKWLDELGAEVTEQMLQKFLEVSPVTVRIKSGVSAEDKESLLNQMKEQGIEVTAHPYLPYAYTISHLEGMHQVPGFSQGLIAVQDVSSMLAVEAAGIRAGDLVLDVCAAPGGKAMLAAEKTGPEGLVIARDISDMKVSFIEENAGRMCLDQIRVQVQDATVLDETMIGKADVVIADLPCSGLGIIAKKRDIKYNVTQESLVELRELQRQILDVVSQYVKPGGTLLYSTCTVNPMENEDNRTYILQELGFEAVNIDTQLPEALCSETTREGYLQLIPSVHETDGFFISVFRRK